MSRPVLSRGAAAIAAMALSAGLLGAVAPSASAAVVPAPSESLAAASAVASGAAPSWFRDPRTPAQRRSQLRVPAQPSRYDGKLRETRAVYRTHAGDLAVPARYAFGHQLSRGQALTLDQSGLFDMNTADLSNAAKKQLRRTARALRNASAIRCEGYANYGSDVARAKKLANARAARVCRTLASVHPGLSTKVVGYGSTHPAVVGGTAQQRDLNRRVVVQMTGTRPLASPSKPTATVPSAPQLLRVQGGDQTAAFFFTAPATDGGSAITGYQVSTGTGWASVATAPDASGLVGATTRRVLQGRLIGLPSETRVTVRVRAVNATGAGATSSPMTAAVFGRPSVPADVVVTNDAGTVTLSFGAPARTGGSPITAYQVSYDGARTWTDTGVSGAAPWTLTRTGLELGAVHDVRVRAVNKWGPGAAGGDEILVVAPPSAPRDVVGTVEGTTARLAFSAPASDGGSAVTHYQVSVDNGPWQNAPMNDGAVAVASQTWGTHSYRLRAVNAVGASDAATGGALTFIRPATIYRSEYMYSDGTLYLNAFFNKVPDAVSYEARVDGGAWLPVRISINWDAQALGYIDDPVCGATECTADLTLEMRAVMNDGPGPVGPKFTSKRF